MRTLSSQERFTGLAVVIASSLASACAGSSVGVVERDFSRPILERIPLERIDVVTVVAGPPVSSPPVLSVTAFEAPTPSTALRPGDEHEATRRALVDALQELLTQRGFGVEHVVLQGAHADVALPVAPLPPVETSTTAMLSVGTATTVAERTDALPARDDGVRPGGASRSTVPSAPASLAETLAASSADAVLVVRAVLVDDFYVFVEGKPRFVVGPDGGRQPRVEKSAVPARGRLLVGQAFLFDRATGLRLWSRQVPDFPEGGRLSVNDPFLAYGVMLAPDAPAMTESALAKKAAGAFAQAMFSKFPSAQAGDPAARAELDNVDVASERARQAFLDESRFAVSLEAAYALEGAGASVALDGAELPSLGTGAIAPSGLLGGAVRVSYLGAGGLVLDGALSLRTASSDFRRSYHRDNPDPSLADPNDRGASLQIDGARAYGASVGVGRALVISDGLVLVPTGAAFVDVWSLRATPAVLVGETGRIRVGAEGNIALLYVISADFLYARGGLSLRAGWDSEGPVFAGGGLSLGLGVFL